MINIPQLINDLGGSSKFGRLLGVGPSTASEMKRRKKIPVQYWNTVIVAARQNGLKVTAEDLIAAHTDESNAA